METVYSIPGLEELFEDTRLYPNSYYLLQIGENFVSNLEEDVTKTALTERDNQSFVHLNGTKYCLLRFELTTIGATYLQLIPTSELFPGMEFSVQYCILYTAALLLFALLFAFTTFRIIKKPIDDLSATFIKLRDRHFDIRIDGPNLVEFVPLYDSFNEMAEQLDELIQKEFQQTLLLEKAQLKQLQAQINPHFLYNSLDSVIWFLRMGKNKDAEKMLTELSTLFKISLSKGREIITIEDELKHIGSYLFISNMIYSKKFTYSIECDPSLYQYQTPKLLLQPLAENAILHAVPLPDEKVHIHVSIRENGDCLLLSVQDISQGMSPETLEILRKQINAPRQPDKQDSGYGLYNVNERIRIFYGPDFGLNIDSDPDIGTEITLKIPKLERGEPYVPSNPV